MELDPVFVKALKLLHSKTKESTEQLKQMLDDVIAKHRGGVTSSRLDKKGDGGSNRNSPVERIKEAEKRSLDKLKQDISDLSGSDPPKKMKFDPKSKYSESSNSSSSSSSSRGEKESEKERVKEKLIAKVKDSEKVKTKEVEKLKSRDVEKIKHSEKSSKSSDKSEETETDTEDEGSNLDAGDFAMDMGISCIVCRQFDVSPGNQLIECQECHSLYHQECHRPPVMEQDVNDPRFVWYCSKCSRNLKKMVAKPQKSKGVPPSIPVAKESSSSKTVKSDAPAVLPFKRMEPVKPSNTRESPTSQNSKPLMGLASLAANLSGKADTGKGNSKDKTDSSSKAHSSSKSDSSKLSSSGSSKSLSSYKQSGSSSSSSGSNKGSSSSSSALPMKEADKRLLMMKKKAAKIKEKKIHYS